MASCALLLSTSLLPTSPADSTSFSHRAADGVTPGALRMVASSRNGVASSSGSFEQFSSTTRMGFSGARITRRGGVVCEMAVELGGSRSSEGEKKVEVGTKVRVKGSLKVYHVPKNPELDIDGLEGEVKEVVTTFKGKPVSATFPYKVQLVTMGEESRKFFVHLKDDEFEVLD
ncbi:ferredoxin-thioredoxin reductase subunit A1, chloroplastic [Physcomitrium patens]|uniref:Ferredoxin thioredoxin reductase alpha chain domain-containing protein n=1 Tax=Physcomitrium patens TaxID=3218 RepID=A0A2K1KQJ5_PHYPA|nr:ferredoxin-thioredoxin reductase, variable chain, chloroplastic-like [Physcomitrium patens]PNR56073.1 hypothetical protein PHYPA_006970 [Physcomitrium patens]|eukprot:XP_024372577.1 ferredoxin-thioredoxin reductase, variable chain, chloroplastic-like [Physcomitrella patens]